MGRRAVMRSGARFAIVAAATIAALVALDGALHQHLPIEVHLTVVGGLALAAAVRAVTGRCDPAAWRAPALLAPRRRPARDPVPDALSQWIALVATASEDGRAAAARLGPRLSILATAHLAARRGIDARVDRAAAVHALGPAAAGVVWPAVTRDRWSAGVPVDDVRAVVDALERLA